MIDLHALPGGANDQDHSGTSSHKAELWENPKYLETAKFCATWLATQVKNDVLKGCIGIQLCNEASAGAKGLSEWYGEVIDAISEIDVSIPLYVSDAWDLPSVMNLAALFNAPESPVNPVIVATSRYVIFLVHFSTPLRAMSMLIFKIMSFGLFQCLKNGILTQEHVDTISLPTASALARHRTLLTLSTRSLSIVIAKHAMYATKARVRSPLQNGAVHHRLHSLWSGCCNSGKGNVASGEPGVVVLSFGH